MARRSPSLVDLRDQIADEAARLIRDHGIQDYGLAKRKAAARFGVSMAGALPSNAEIQARVLERQRVFDGADERDRLAHMRRLAVELMEVLEPFEPRLAGATLMGTISPSSRVELHLFTDAPEEVLLVLEGRGLGIRNCQRRYRYNGNGRNPVIVPGFRVALRGEQIDALVFPEKGLRQAPMSPIDGRPMRRADCAKVRALLASA